MHNDRSNLIEERDDLLRAENQEDILNCLSRLQYVIGFLIQRNEQLRQELTAKSSEG